jgi:PAS domain S-box-containing protein
MSAALQGRLAELAAEARRLSAQPDARGAKATLRALIGPLPEAAFVANDAGLYVLSNMAAAKMTGYSAAELDRLSVWDLTPLTNAREGEVLWRAFIQQGRQRGEYRLSARDGHIVIAQYAALANVLPGFHLALLSI